MPIPKRTSLRKHLAEMDAETLREELERIVEKFPEVKKFYLADLSGDTSGIVNAAKTSIERCFKTSTGKWRRARSSKLNAVVRDFEKISVFREDVLALLYFRLEETAPYLNHFRPSVSPLLDATVRVFEQVCGKSKDYQLDEKYQPLLLDLISRFDDSQLRKDLKAVYEDYFGKNASED